MKNKKLKNRLLSGLLATSISLGSTACNYVPIDTKYGQNKALVVGDDTAIAFDIDSWKDYEGEQYQIATTDGLIILTASFDTDLFFSKSDKYDVKYVAKNSITNNGEVYDHTGDSNKFFNYDLLDTEWVFNKAVLFNGNNAVQFNILNWRDYEGEQLQIETDENLVLLLSSYNSKLFYDKQSTTKAEDFAKMYIGSDGKFTELGKETETSSIINYNLIDLQYKYNKAIIFKDKKAIIVPVSSWKDYEGEQLQIEITNGPTIVTAAYDTILLDDSKSTSKANDVAKNISEEVIDLTENKRLAEGVFNKTIIDLEYGFKNAIISNNDSSASLPIKKWCDYEGEQLQVVLPNGDVMLTSSIFLDLINGGSSDINANTLASNYATEKVYLKSTNPSGNESFNKQIIDLDLKFNYALHIENGNVTIIPLKKWKDYYNSNGKTSTERKENPDGTRHKVVTTDEASPNCEQLQLTLPDDTVILTSAYDTILLKTNNINEYAELFRGNNSTITDLTSVFGEPNSSSWNFTLIDTTWHFNYAIYNNGENSQVFNITGWKDYADGEQVQLYFEDGSGIVSSYCNTSLIYSHDQNKVDAIAKAFAGDSEKAKVYNYK